MYTNAIKRDHKSVRLLKVYIGRVVPTCFKIKEKTAEKRKLTPKREREEKQKVNMKEKRKRKNFTQTFNLLNGKRFPKFPNQNKVN